MKKKVKGKVSMYGSVAMVRKYCERCLCFAFVIDDEIQCCDTMVGHVEIEVAERIAESVSRRARPSKEAQDEILAKQDNKCLYCLREFGDIGYRNNKRVRLVINWDHVVPYSYEHNNFPENFAASCQVCNQIKSDRLYPDLETCRVSLAIHRSAKGYSW